MKPQEYQKCALRTLYPDLTMKDRLGLCGLGLPGEIGEVVDHIKKYLYHRNGKPLDIHKLKDELGDVLWYSFVLLDTVGLTFEQVTNVTELEQRRTISSDLAYNERLGFCGQSLAGKLGRVVERLCSVLYQNVPLDTNKLKDELSDVLWHYFVLLDTLGISFEEVMEASAEKLLKRHPNGFNPHYASDSSASER